MRFIGFLTLLTITGCLEPQGEVSSPKSLKDEISLIDVPDNEIDADTIIYLDSNNVLSIMKKDGSYLSLDGNTLSDVKTAAGLAENSTNYIAADGTALTLEDQNISVVTGGNTSNIGLTIDTTAATVKQFSSDKFTLYVDGYTIFVSNEGTGYDFNEDDELRPYNSIVACKSGCDVWAVKGGKVHYKDDSGDWLQAEGANIIVDSLSDKRLAGALSIANNKATFEELFYLSRDNKLYRWDSSLAEDNSGGGDTGGEKEDSSELEGFERVLFLAEQQNCISCHQAFNYDTEEGWRAKKEVSAQRVSVEMKGTSKEMPPSYATIDTPMTDEDRKFLVDYINSL